MASIESGRIETKRTRHSGYRIGLFAMMIALLLAMTVQSTSAHGQDRVLQLSNAMAGPFRLTAWTTPSILRPGEIHVETAVLGADGAPHRDVLLQLSVSPLDGSGQPLTALARPVAATNGVIQEAAVTLWQPGPYQVAVTILGPGGESGRASFPIEVVRVASVTRLGLHALLFASLLASGWVLKQGRRIWFGDKRLSTPRV